MAQILIETWHGCYDDSWDGFIVPEAFAHPAKYARGLITRIFQHMLDEGMLHKGDTCVDPFGGIASGGVVAAGLGLQWFGCELEAKFHALGNQNIEMHRALWEQFGDPVPVLVNGDSRKLRENLRGVLAQAVVSSPPYAESVTATDKNMEIKAARLTEAGYDAKAWLGNARCSQLRTDHYGQTPGQLGAMKPGDVDSVVSSPPYNLPMSQDHNGSRGGARGTEPSEGGAFVKYGSTPGQLEGLPMGDVAAVVSSPPYVSGGHHPDQTGAWNKNGGGHNQSKDTAGYGRTSGQIGQMKEGDIDAVISSPPYAESLKGDNSERETAEASRAKRVTEGGSLGQSCRHSGYGGPGNLGNLDAGSVDSVVTSPPYEGSEGTPSVSRLTKATGGTASNKKQQELGINSNYGYTDGQLGRGGGMDGETFWSAARDIVAECHAILKPGGYSAWVVKDFIRNKQRVPFCDDWCKLLEACGFVVVKRVRAMLVKESRHPDLFGGEDHVDRTERKSFFRRLYEKKYPENSINWEEVIFAQKP